MLASCFLMFKFCSSGEGCFGQVWKCEALNIDGRKGVTMVAVKMLKESASQKEKDDLLSELKLMKMLLAESHPNVVRLLGACTGNTDKEPTYVIMEYVSKGKLQEFLRKSRAEHYYGNLHGSSQKLTSRDLTSFCYQVSTQYSRHFWLNLTLAVVGCQGNGVFVLTQSHSQRLSSKKHPCV